MGTVAGLANDVQRFLADYGLIALFVLILVEEAGVWLPLPGDLLIMYFGARVTSSRHPLLDLLLVIAVTCAAAVSGSFLLYLLTRRFHGLIHRLGPLIRLDEHRLAWMGAQLQKHGTAIIIPARLVPGLRVVTTAVCGAFRVPAVRFVPAVAIASAIWAIAFMALGAAGLSVAGLLRSLIPDAPLEWLFAGLIVLALAAVVLLARRVWSHSDSD
jgi:membrane-associated protein